MKSFLLLIGVFLARISFAQLQFQIDTVFFKNQYIAKVSVGLDSNVWVIKNQDSTEIGQITASLTEIDHSAAFHGYTTSKFNDILALDSGIAYVGSQTDYLIRFQNGSFIKLNGNNGVLNPNINSIIYSRKCQAFTPFMPRIFIGTDSGAYISTDRYQFDLYLSYPQKTTYLIQNSDYNYLHLDTKDTVPGLREYNSYTYARNGIELNHFLPLDSPVKNQRLFTSITVNYEVNSSQIVGDYYWGTNYALIKKNYQTPIDGTILMEKHNFYKLFNLRYFPAEDYSDVRLEDRYLFVGTDSGLYYFPISYNETVNDSLILVPNTAHLKVYDIDADRCNTTLWIATDQGLVRILLDYSGDFSFSSFAKDNITPKGDVLFCPGDKPILTGPSGNIAYQWQRNGLNLAGETERSYKATQAGTYRVLLNRTGTCWSLYDTTTTVTLDPDALIISFVHPDTIKTCGNNPVSVSTTYDPAYSYQWFKDGAALKGDTLNEATVFEEGHYYVRVTNCNGISKVSDSLFVEDVGAAKPFLYKDSLPALCEGDTLWLGPLNGTIINWYKDYQVQQDYRNNSSYPVTTSGTYTAELFNKYYCMVYADTLQLRFNPIPSVQIQTDKKLPFCEKDTLLLTALTNAGNITWSTGSKGKVIAIEHSGKYIVEAEENGCLSRDTLIASFYPSPSLFLGSDTTFCEGKLIPIQLHAGKGHSRYIWNGKETGDSTFLAAHAGPQIATIFNSFGCAATDTLNINNYCDPYFIPNLITPNADSKNDTFEIINLLPRTEVTIYDRWGGIVYHNSEYANEWTADRNSSGIYYYYIRSDFDKKEWKGWINVVK